VQRLIDISEGWYITSQENGNWYFNDLRFGLIPIDPENPQFVFRYQLLQKDGDVIAKEDRPQPENASAIFGTLWERIKGN
jgi:inner membrane protein